MVFAPSCGGSTGLAAESGESLGGGFGRRLWNPNFACATGRAFTAGCGAGERWCGTRPASPSAWPAR